MSELNALVTARTKYLSELITSKKNALERVPQGSLRANPHGKTYQYFHRTDNTDSNGKYLKTNERELAASLAQKEYDTKVLKSAEKEKSILCRLENIYQKKETPEDLFEKQAAGKQPLIIPVQIPDGKYIDLWKSEPYRGLEFRDSPALFFSDNGEQMRSKSEVIIANLLKRYHVPYKYECPLLLDGKTVYPDFTLLNVSKRKEIYWEHLGLLDDPDYHEKALLKITRYELNGYYPGEKLILSFETQKLPLNMKLVERLITKFCK